MPMTLRTLKKRSKQAMPILRAYFPDRIPGTAFLAERGENYHGLVIRCTHGSGDPSLVPERPHCDCTDHPLPGTPMLGAVEGYYEPEWNERTAYEVLRDLLQWEGKPDAMPDAEWARALRIVGWTPDGHAKYLADLPDEFARMAAEDWDAIEGDADDADDLPPAAPPRLDPTLTPGEAQT